MSKKKIGQIERIAKSIHLIRDSEKIVVKLVIKKPLISKPRKK
jgi:hypothetical protein